MKPKLTLSILSSTWLGSRLIFIFSFSRTSPDPHLEETALLPCFATLIPKLDNKIAEAVDIFKVFLPSPPVPQVSIALPIILTFFALFLRTNTPPAISSGVSPFSESKVKNL